MPAIPLRFALVLGALAVAMPASADHTSLHATGSGEVAYTNDPTSGDFSNDARAFTTLRPGLLYAVDGPRLTLESNGQAEIVENLMNGDHTPSILGKAGIIASYLPGPRSNLTLGLNGDKGLSNLLASRTTADQTDPTLMPVGNVSVWHADANQNLSYEWRKDMSFGQGAMARYNSTDDGFGTRNRTMEGLLSLDVSRQWQRSTLGLSLSANYVRLTRESPTDGNLGRRDNDQLGPRLTANWRHDLGQRWSVGADGGAAMLVPVSSDGHHASEQRRLSVYGVGGGTLAYTELWGNASLALRHDVTPNQFLAQNTIGDSARLRVSMPISWLGTRRDPQFAVSASLGYERTQIINDDTGQAEGDFRTARADVSLNWTPGPATSYGLRYEFIRQTSGGADLMTGESIPSFNRGTMFFTFSYFFPRRVNEGIAKQGRPLRSDGMDKMPAGAEPVVPE